MNEISCNMPRVKKVIKEIDIDSGSDVEVAAPPPLPVKKVVKKKPVRAPTPPVSEDDEPVVDVVPKKPVSAKK